MSLSVALLFCIERIDLHVMCLYMHYIIMFTYFLFKIAITFIKFPVVLLNYYLACKRMCFLVTWLL